MHKPIHITIEPQIDTDPAKTFLIRVEGDKDQIFDLLDHAEECGCDSYEIVKYPAGVDIPASRHGTILPSPKAPIKGFYALIKYYDEPEADPREVFIAQTLDVDEDHPQDADVFYYAGDFPEERIRKDFAYKPNDSAEEWYIVDKVDGCGCMNSPPCLGCAPKTHLPIDDVPTSFCDNCGKEDYSDKMHHHGSSPTDTASANKGESVTLCSKCARNFDEQGLSEDEKDLSSVPDDPDANLLNLYAVWTINSDTSETDKVYIMALHEEGAACLYHQSRARDHGNILCEVVVSKVADAEVCDG